MTCYSSSTVDYYDTNAEEYIQSTIRLDLHELYKPFLRQLPSGAHILDAGCGSGRDTKAFLDLGFRVTAIDASSELARLATIYTGQVCQVMFFHEMKFQDEFDGIWACASILHVPKSEMDIVMPLFIRALKPGGVFYISLKEGEGEGIMEGGRFFNYYTVETFRALLRRFPSLGEIAFWKSDETRSRHHSGPWLNFLLKKVARQLQTSTA